MNNASDETPRKRRLLVFSPLPPARNGIADYALEFINNIKQKYSVIALTDSMFANKIENVKIINELFASQYIEPDALLVYQIGNNPDHVFVLRAARRRPGIVVLHDPKLLYLYQNANTSSRELRSLMIASNPLAAKTFAIDPRSGQLPTRFEHAVFDGLAEIVNKSRAIVVHSQYAKSLIRLYHGSEAAAKTSIIPHFAYPDKPAINIDPRQTVKLDRDAFIIVTAGFAHRRKRYEWLVQGLDQFLKSHTGRVIWVQAGEVRKNEYDLESLLKKYPAVQKVARLAGYVDEDELDSYIRSADVLVNLRFPTDGESSGSLARAFSAGVCCMVNNTGAFKELPNDIVIHIPVIDAPNAIASALRQLIENPDLRDKYRAASRRYAEQSLSIDNYISTFCNVIDNTSSQNAVSASNCETSRMRIPADLQTAQGLIADLLTRSLTGANVSIGPVSLEIDATNLLRAILPEGASARQIEFQPTSWQPGTHRSSYMINCRIYLRKPSSHSHHVS